MTEGEPTAGGLGSGPGVGPGRTRTLVLAALAALLGAGLPHWLLGDFDLNLMDEGFLWYGVERVLAGEVPLRDFQAYDPGRYYWCAAWTPLFGAGILGVRAALALFAGLGLFFGTLACARVARGPLELVLAAAGLAAWMFPRHKSFEPALALIVLYVALRLVERPTIRAHAVAGLLTGLLAWFGRNHALYAGLSFVALGGLLAWKLWPVRVGRLTCAFAAGIALGSAPLWGMFLGVPGFAAAFAHSLRSNLEHGANLALPYPWPWTVAWGGLGGLELLGTAALALAFLLPFVLLPLGAWAALACPRERLGERALVLAAFFVGATYVHHVAVRSAVAHLAQCIHPLLVLGLALPACARWSATRGVRVLVWSALAALTLFATLRANPLLAQLGPAGRHDLVEHVVRGEELRLEPDLAAYLTVLEGVVAERVPPDETLFLAPANPGLYAVLDKPSPSWWIYFFWVAGEEAQRQTIAELERRGLDWALIFTDSRLDGRAELAFKNSNPLVWQHLVRNFEPLVEARLPRGQLLLRRRSAAGR